MPSQSDRLPLTRTLKPVYWLSAVSGTLMTAASLGGLLFTSAFYPTDELQRAFLANDLVNLIIGLPALLAAVWLARRGKWVGLLTWPGALLYVLYNYSVYLLGIPLGLLTIAYLTLVLLSAWGFVLLLARIDRPAVGERLYGEVPVKFAGWVLVLFGVGFLARAVGMFAEAGSTQTVLPMTEVGLLAADMIFSALWITGGISLLRRQPLGYTGGLGLLLTGCTLFIGLIIVLLVGPILTEAVFAPVDVIVVALMGLVCFVPFGLYLRGVMSVERTA